MAKQDIEVSPLMAISVHRECDWVSLDDSTTYAVCLDKTKWRVVLEEAPVAAWNLAPDTRDSAKITISADDDHGPPKEPALILDFPGYLQDIRYSWYNPALGGPNCSQFVGGQCISKMANQERWQDHVGEAVACPPEWEFRTTVELDGQTWTCRDRGGKIKFVDGIPWVDFLRTSAAYTYGSIMQVRVIEK